MWITLLTNPKNLAIIILSLLVVVTGIFGFYYKEKNSVLEAQIKVLTQENINLKSQLNQANQHNAALQKQIKDNEKIVIDYAAIQKRIDDLKKKCPQVITIAKPKPPVKTTVVSPTGESKVSLVPIPTPDELKQGVSTKPNVEEQPKETTQEVVQYEWGGPEYEKEAISVYNDLVTLFNSDSVRNNATNTTSSENILSSTSQTSPKTIGLYQDVGISGQCIDYPRKL